MEGRGIADFKQSFLVNELLGAVNRFQTQEEWDKLSAMAELAGVSDSKSLMKLAEYMESFAFIPDVQNEEDLARYWIKENEEYEISPELEDYFLYEQFGEQIENDTEGMFLPEGGYVYVEDGHSIEEFLQDEENLMMGGI